MHWLKILGWACYLACSWTWCIGMFLPVLLVRDYGIWGFVVFAVPNVVGAAAMGWFVTDREASERLVRAHSVACSRFSIITIAFHAFFLLFLTGSWFSSKVALAAIIVVFSLSFLARAFAPRNRVLGFTGIMLLFSLAAACILIATGSLSIPDSPSMNLVRIGPLGLVCGFGFLLCPYLDLTFHEARQATTPTSGKLAFAIGFGVFFFGMILLTFFYADFVSRILARNVAPASFVIAEWALAAHLIGQGILKGVLHTSCVARELDTLRTKPKLSIWWAIVSFVLFLLMLVQAWHGFPEQYAGLSMVEIIYRLFMSFYGLVFPAYVWLCMIPTWRDPLKPTRRHITVWLGACAVAAPCYWMGFIERVEWWLIPGLAVVLLARLLIPPASRGSTPPPAEPSPARVPVHSGPSELSAAATPAR